MEQTIIWRHQENKQYIPANDKKYLVFGYKIDKGEKVSLVKISTYHDNKWYWEDDFVVEMWAELPDPRHK